MKINKKLILFLTGVLVFTLLVVGCAPNNTRDGTPKDNTTPKDTTPNDTTPNDDNTKPNDDDTTPDDTMPDDDKTNDKDNTDTTPGDTTDGDTRVDDAEKIADKVSDMKEVDSATCVITGDTAIVGVQFDKEYKGELTDEIKKNVDDVAKKADKDIDRVVVTADPDLFDRLTAWELMEDNIPVTLISDNMAGYFMQKGEITGVIVGADRIAANGDVANKIGTYTVAVLARENNIPFYVAAPISTLDLNLKSGSEIPIEERDESEITHIQDRRIAPYEVKVKNPAFDVTPNEYITAIITEEGIIRPPYSKNLGKFI